MESKLSELVHPPLNRALRLHAHDEREFNVHNDDRRINEITSFRITIRKLGNHTIIHPEYEFKGGWYWLYNGIGRNAKRYMSNIPKSTSASLEADQVKSVSKGWYEWLKDLNKVNGININILGAAAPKKLKDMVSKLDRLEKHTKEMENVFDHSRGYTKSGMHRIKFDPPKAPSNYTF